MFTFMTCLLTHIQCSLQENTVCFLSFVLPQSLCFVGCEIFLPSGQLLNAPIPSLCPFSLKQVAKIICKGGKFAFKFNFHFLSFSVGLCTSRRGLHEKI